MIDIIDKSFYFIQIIFTYPLRCRDCRKGHTSTKLLLHSIEAVRRAFWNWKTAVSSLEQNIARDEQDSNPFTIKAAFNDEKA